MPEKASVLSFDEFSLLMQSFEPFEDCPRVAVAVSGGSDSLALTILLHEWVRKKNGTLTALTVDHQLRSESRFEAQQVQNWLQAYNIHHVTLNWRGAKPTSGIQEAARFARYQLLENWCQNNGYLHLVLGHQQEDQIETIIMRMLNQSGLLGLAGMSNIVEKSFVRLLRPLLTTSRLRLQQNLKNQAQGWIEDPSNRNPQFQRGYLRQAMPENGMNLIHSHSLLQQYRVSAERWLNQFLAHHSSISPFGHAEVKRSDLLALPVEFQKPILLQVLKTIGVGRYQPRMSVLHSVLTRIQSLKFHPVTCHGVRISLQRDQFLFVREHQRVLEEWALCETKESSHYFDQRFEVQVSVLKQHAGSDVYLKRVGEEGWQQLIHHYPELKRISLHKPILWSLPAAWRGPEILLKYNMIYEWLIMSQEKNQQKNFIFKPYYPFSCFIFSRSS